MKNVSDEPGRENKKTHSKFNNFFFSNRDVYEVLLKNIVEPGRPQMKIWRMHIPCYKHTLRICNTYRFSTATIVARTRLSVILYVYCLSC